MVTQNFVLTTWNLCFLEAFENYRYMHMYLKKYAKFTFCIKSQGHVSDKTFCITVYNWLAKFLPTVSEISETKIFTFIYC